MIGYNLGHKVLVSRNIGCHNCPGLGCLVEIPNWSDSEHTIKPQMSRIV